MLTFDANNCEQFIVAFKVYWDVNLRNPLRTGDEVSDKESTVALKPRTDDTINSK